MTPETYQRIMRAVDAVMDAPAAEISERIAAQCGGDANLCRAVENLLAADGTDLFEVSPIEKIFRPVEPADAHLGRLFGAYRVLEKIGAGGMGAVYLAERADGEFTQKVAVKVIRRETDSKFILNRFRRERQILATLEHPHIARLLDGGTTPGGTPYFVMEYVEGLPIDDLCRARNLSLDERLELFRQVCAAVVFAHQNLIIHRDLKPSNILIAKDGTPKLLDFGIAKIVGNEAAGESAATETHHIAFTPEYAAPEQLRGETLTTAADIYSLGALLYKIVAGKTPHDLRDKNFGQIVRLVCETEPPKPSEASAAFADQIGDDSAADAQNWAINPKVLRGDLDNIILKAVNKDSARRYTSVENFSEDILRYLKGLPVAARADTFSYRARKFACRNRLASAAALFAFISLITGIVTAGFQARRADAEKERAEHRAANVRKISNTLIVDIHNAIRNLPGNLPARELLLERSVEQIAELAREADADPSLRGDLAIGYYNIGEMYQALGNTGAAEENHLRAVEIYQNLAAQEPQNSAYKLQLSKGYGFLGDIYYLRGAAEKSVEYYRRAPETLETADSNDLSVQEELWNAYYNYAIAFCRMGKPEAAISIAERMQPIAENLRRSSNASLNNRRKPYLTRAMRASGLFYQGNYKESIAELNRVIGKAEAERKNLPVDFLPRYDLWNFHRRLGTVYGRAKNFAQAEREFQQSIELIDQLMTENPQDAGHKRNSAVTHLNFAQILLAENKPAEALTMLKNAQLKSEELLAKDSQNGETLADLAAIYAALGAQAAKIGKYANALEWQNKSLEIFQKSLKKNDANALMKNDYVQTLVEISDTHSKLKDFVAARQTLELARKICDQMNAGQTLTFSVNEKNQAITQRLEKLAFTKS